jgi:hypothetical protein
MLLHLLTVLVCLLFWVCSEHFIVSLFFSVTSPVDSASVCVRTHVFFNFSEDFSVNI